MFIGPHPASVAVATLGFPLPRGEGFQKSPMNLSDKLQPLGLNLPPAPKPVASYVPAVRVGQLIYVSGQLPMVQGKLMCTGRVPGQVSIEQAQQAARQCVLNTLAIVNDQLQGDWSQFERVVRVGVFVASDDDFVEQPKVANGASDLLVTIFGDAGKHARAAVGVNTLPLGAPVELELLVAVKG